MRASGLGMNRLFIINDKSVNLTTTRATVVSGSTFHPCKPFFIKNKLTPESFASIYSKGVFEVTPFLREVIKKTDYLLAPHGDLVIDYFMPEEIYTGGEYLRPLSFFMYEFSLSVGERYKLKEKEVNGRVCRLRFEKIAQALPKEDDIIRWSFGIASDGRKNDRVNAIIQQIQALKIPEHEILICGPPPSKKLPPKVRVFDDSDLAWDIRPPVTAKKNRLITHARFNNLVLIHDRINFPENWYAQMQTHGNFFEVLCPQILDEETETRRVQDWLRLKGDFNDYRTVKGELLDYDAWHPDIYVDGGCLIVKRHKLLPILYNQRLHWGEAEDVDISRRLYQAGVMTNLYLGCAVTTETHRHPGNTIKESMQQKLRKKIGLRTKIEKKTAMAKQIKCFEQYLLSL